MTNNSSMKLRELINKLKELEESYGEDAPVYVMEEHKVKDEVVQFTSAVTDTAVSRNHSVLIIGQELYMQGRNWQRFMVYETQLN